MPHCHVFYPLDCHGSYLHGVLVRRYLHFGLVGLLLDTEQGEDLLGLGISRPYEELKMVV